MNAADVRLLSFDVAMKYRGFFVQTEIYNRWIDKIDASDALPVSEIVVGGQKGTTFFVATSLLF